MNGKRMMISAAALLVALVLPSGCCRKPASETEWSFVFMTDIHLQPECQAVAGFSQAIDSVNARHPDFVVTGGDLNMDALGAGYGRADSLYTLYLETARRFQVPVYNAMGNHEIFGLYPSSGVQPDHPEYGKRMFDNRIGRRHYSFHHKGWHFIILDSVGETEERKYIGRVDSAQMAWIRSDLDSLGPDVPIAVVTHIPFVTSMTQLYEGSLEPNGQREVINNSKEVLDLFAGHDLKLVLQGHLHFLEDIFVRGQTHFITGGAVCSKWWEGKRNGLEEGFLHLRVRGRDVSWEYVDYGWDAKPE
ncbi:MAG: metallophosphoesterase [bacterium]|nr:metallophosphoesterase [bacterium]